MSLRDAYLRATVETGEQLDACLGHADMVYIDSGFFKPSDYASLVLKAHEAGSLLGLRFPRIWRDKAEDYFDEHIHALHVAGFDAYLLCNAESLLYCREHGLLDNTEFATDSSMYIFNHQAVYELTELVPEDVRLNYVSATLPLELNSRELADLCNRLHDGVDCVELAPGIELTVYGRAPMMVTAQCINKTVSGCDKREKTLFLKDRKSAKLPVRNCCNFCYNLIYNSVSTYIYDMTDIIKNLSPDALRYDFTTETAAEVKDILSGVTLRTGSYTRGHLNRGV